MSPVPNGPNLRFFFEPHADQRIYKFCIWVQPGYCFLACRDVLLSLLHTILKKERKLSIFFSCILLCVVCLSMCIISYQKYYSCCGTILW
jgi:hypothetical protein